MARASRTRTIAAPPGELWRVISDPYHLPRWWPRVSRVENVRGAAGQKRTRWTVVYETEGGRGVRADFRCTGATADQRYAWEQELEGSPFERFMRSLEVEVGLEPAGEGTEVTVTADQRLRGVSRFGTPMAKGALRRQLDEALTSLESVSAEPAAQA